jgi:hypothetical protein
VKVRQNGRIVPVAVIVRVGVNSHRRRDVLGMDICPSEAETFWTAFLRKLACRGPLRDPIDLVSDNNNCANIYSWVLATNSGAQGVDRMAQTSGSPAPRDQGRFMHGASSV